MSYPSRASMRTRFLKLLIPMGLVGLVVGFFTWSSLKHGIGNLEALKHISELSISTRVHVSDMGSAMKGYLLNPSDQSEYERKKAADDANSAALAELEKLVSDPQILQLIKEMAEFDEKELNPAEDKVMNFVKDQHLDEARTSFVSEYLPLRAKYDALSKQLVEKTAKYASDAAASVDAGLQKVSYMIMALLAGGLLITAVLSIWSVGQLSKEFRIVADGLSDISARLNNSSASLSTASVRLADTSTESASALEETTTSIRELNEAFHRNAERSSSAASVSGRSRSNAVDGRESVQRMANAINEIENGNSEINERITESNNRISEITTVINEIGQKTRVINDIVFQTKLLSFNASVEAARAGEHGKGFAVVAEEVGNLARMSGQAAQEISHLLDQSVRKVESIVEDTRRSVEGLMESNRNRVTVGARIADECASALQQIVSAAEESEKLALEISDSTKMQSTRIESVTTALEEIAKAVHDMADSSHATSEASNGLRTDAAGLLENVRSLSTLVDGGSSQPPHNVVNMDTQRLEHPKAA